MMRYTYTGQELFMEKLKQLINYNYNPLINNHPSVLSQMPRFQMLYQQLDNMIQTLLLIQDERYHHQQLQQVTDLKKRFKDAAEEAYDIVDLFLYNINLNEEVSLNLEDVMRSIKSIKDEFITICDNMKIDSAPTTYHIKTVPSAAAGTSCTKNPLRTKKALEDVVVGFDGHVELIRDKLAEDQKQLDVVSIVGMGGVGNTTLATKVFNDPFIMYHFHVRGWVTVSQAYEKQDLIIQILESIGNKIDDVRGLEYSQLRQMLHQKLMGKRYLIVIDDIWSTEAWNDLKLSFPNNHTGSRILLTSRLKDVASHAKSHGFIHQLEYLSEEESWELLCKKVFHGDECPEYLIEPGKQIASNCHGLPLTLVVIAGVLAKEAPSKDSWDSISQSVTSFVVSDQTGYIETLALSFNHLPGHLRDCFLYFGGFPEDYRFGVRRLIWLWMAEGFIQEDGIRSLEEIAEDHVMELVDINLVVVGDRKSNGGIKSFHIHDLLRELCLKMATKENFCLRAERITHSIKAYKQRRIFVKDDYIVNFDFRKSPRVRSLLDVDDFYYDTQNVIRKWSRFWMLLMVLDLRYGYLSDFPEGISQLIHLRYLAISCYREFPSSICKLWSLQTLIIKCEYTPLLELPSTISDMVNLRHLKYEGRTYMLFPAIQKSMNLQTISRVALDDSTKSWFKRVGGIKKLSCSVVRYMECDFESLTFLENLKLSRHWSVIRTEQKVFGLPASLKSLTLETCELLWSDISVLQSLPNLEVLKLLDSIAGPRWDAVEEPFRQLKFLKLYKLEFKQWEASSVNFPCLKELVLMDCYHLEEIPSEIGYIPTLELISISNCKDTVIESADNIQQKQIAQGNFELKIHVDNQYFDSD